MKQIVKLFLISLVVFMSACDDKNTDIEIQLNNDPVSTTEDEGLLNYGEEGAAGDNIANSDIFNGGTF